MLASISDLQHEQWLRLRNAGKIVWKTKDGMEIPINQMTDQHLTNTIAMLERLEAAKDAYYSGPGFENYGDGD